MHARARGRGDPARPVGTDRSPVGSPATRAHRGAAAGLLCLALLAWLAQPASVAGQAPLDRDFLALVNAERTAHGLQPLRIHTVAQRRAEQWTEAQIRAGTVSHQRLDDLLIPPIQRVGENVGVHSQGLSRLFHGLLESPAHRANLLSPDFTHVGIAVRRGKFQGLDALWTTQVFLVVR